MQESKAIKAAAVRMAARGARRRAGVLAGAAALLCVGAASWVPSQAWAESDAVKQLAAPPPIQLPLRPSPEFAKFPRYVGTLGTRPIVLRLGPKTDDPSGVHGEYQYTDSGEVILIAGDRMDDTLEVEESNDGTHITGNWVGKFAADGSLEGDRMNVDDSNPQPFALRLAAGQQVPVAGTPAGGRAAQGAAAPQAPAEKAATARAAAGATAGTAAGATPGATPAAPVFGAGGHPVGGVSNLQTGD